MLQAIGRLVVVVGLLSLIGPFASVSSRQPDVEVGGSQFRAYWVDSFGPGLYTETQIDQLVTDTKAANMNAIVAQVTRRADCLCNRSMMPRTEAEVDALPFDPLQTLIDKAHGAGIEVHAWLNATIMWGGETPPTDPAHVFHTHGPSATGRDNWVSVRHDGANRGANIYFFDPGHPDAADYIVNMFLSIVRNYEVDGINFDYIRYPDFNMTPNTPTWGYNPVALARFQAASGRTDVPAPADPQWMDWRREQVTSIVRRVYIEAYAINPRVRLSADTIAYGSFSESGSDWRQTRTYIEVLQDWRAWLEEGILDLNIPMNYKQGQSATEPNNHRRMYEEWNEFIKDHQYNRHAAIGTALYLNPIEDSVAQIRRGIAPSAAGNRARGWVGFSYRTPDILVNQRRRPPEDARMELMWALTRPSEEDPRLSQSAFGLLPVFADPAPLPVMPWKMQPSTGHLRGVVKGEDGRPADQVRVDLYDAGTDMLVASRRTDGSGWFGFAELTPREYTVSVETTAPLAAASTAAVIVAGQATSVSLTLSSTRGRR